VRGRESLALARARCGVFAQELARFYCNAAARGRRFLIRRIRGVLPDGLPGSLPIS